MTRTEAEVGGFVTSYECVIQTGAEIVADLVGNAGADLMPLDCTEEVLGAQLIFCADMQSLIDFPFCGCTEPARKAENFVIHHGHFLSHCRGH